MELKDFVKNTILDIVNGVREAQKEDTSGALIVVPNGDISSRYGREETLCFDIAIEDISQDSGGGKVGVSAGHLLKAEAGGETASEKTESSRVQFKVQIQFPGGTLAHQEK